MTISRLSDMASFFEELWNSVFAPGPTPTLLAATNTSFACLQLVLLCLLLATYSVHFIVLSFLCGGLWWSINWFVAELGVVKVTDETNEQKQRERSPELEKVPLGESDTETELSTSVVKPSSPRDLPSLLESKPKDADEAPRKRGKMGESSGYLSTDSEWEKISELSGQER